MPPPCRSAHDFDQGQTGALAAGWSAQDIDVLEEMVSRAPGANPPPEQSGAVRFFQSVQHRLWRDIPLEFLQGWIPAGFDTEPVRYG